MNKSPLFYPMNRGADADAGGVADLQTDVMRFMAILALCLVAIFALVQSIPLAPKPIDLPEPAVEPEPAPQRVPEPTPEPEPLPERIPEPMSEPVPEPLPSPRVERPTEPVAEAPRPEPAPAEPPPAPQHETEGFTLRFESDLALTRLVARNEVGLYAISSEKTSRMSINRGRMSFWPASQPNQFHEMDVQTVPGDVVAAYRRSGSFNATTIKWAVTIPSSMSQQLNEYLREASGGALIIGANGELRLER